MPIAIGTKSISTEDIKAAQRHDISINTAEQYKGSIGKEKTGAQILTQPLAGGILFPSYADESPDSYGKIWGNYTDFPGFPCCDLESIQNNNLIGNTEWNYFFGRRAIWYRRIRSMRRDPTINLARILSIAPILAAGWAYEQTDEAEKYPKAKKFIEKEIEPFRLHLIQTGILNCIDFGWQAYEKVFEYLRKDNRIHIRKIKPLLPDLTHIRVDQNGEFIGLQQFQNFASIEKNAIINLDYDESLLYYIDYEGTNWYGNSVMRVAEMPHRYSIIANNAAMRYDLKIAGSHWVVSYPIGQTEWGPSKEPTDNFLIAQSIIQTLEASGAVAIPTMLASYISDLNAVGGEFASEKRDWRIEILSDNSAGSQSFDTRLRYLDSLKFRAFGLPERSASEGQFGTKAEAATQIDFALTHIMFRGDMFCQQTNQGIVNQLLRYNYGPESEGCVYIKQKPLTDEAKNRLFQLYMKLLELPTAEPQEVNDIDFKTLKEKLEIPIIPEEQNEALEESDTEAPVDQKRSLDDILASVNQNYSYLMQGNKNGNGNDRKALESRIRGDAYRDYSHLATPQVLG